MPYVVKRCGAPCASGYSPCGGTPSCDFTLPSLLLDGTTSPVANLSAAAALLAQRAASGCMLAGRLGIHGGTRSLFQSSFSDGILTLRSDASNTSTDVDSVEDYIMARLYLTAAGGITVNHAMSLTFPGGPGPQQLTLHLYADNEATLIAETYGPGFVPTPFNGIWSPGVPSDGYYRLYATALCTSDSPGTWASSIELQCSGEGMIPCTLRAAYGSTPNFLACA